jgi:nicotinate-nucleotide adenylyltransferase
VKAAILGGTFNPVHVGHLCLAEEVRSAFGYERVILVPASIPVHKDPAPVIPGAHRLAMLRLAVAGSEGLIVDDGELVRGGPSWTIDTVAELVPRYGITGRPGLVIGDDLAAGFSAWKDAERLARTVDLILARRTGERHAEFPWPHRVVMNPLITVSSSDIRQRVAECRSIRFLTPDPVIAYIAAHDLYAGSGPAGRREERTDDA